MRRLATFAAAAVLAAWTTAAAQEPTGQPDDVADDPTFAEQDAAEDDDDGFEFGNVQLRGRGMVRGEWYEEEEQSGSDLFDLEDLTGEIRWRPADWLRAELSADAAGNGSLRDAYVRFRFDGFGIRAGQFKQPFSVVQMDSRWDLPGTERGIVTDVLVDSMGLGERRPGLQLRYRWDGKSDLTLRGGAFAASHVRGDRIGDGSFDNMDYGQFKLAGRLSWSRKRLDAGVFGDWRPAEPVPGEGYERLWAAGADLRFIDKPKKGGRRLWLEGFVGSSWQDDDAFDGEHATFLAGRLIGAWRHGGRKVSAWYVEPYAVFGIVDPDTSIRADLMWELLGGLNVGLWERLRLSLEVQHRDVSENAPLSLGLFTWDWEPPPSSRTAFRVQLTGGLW